MTQNLTSFEEADVVFVADMFRDEYAGGGELTTDALLQTTPYKTHCIKSNDLTQQQIQQGAQKTWVFFNFRGMDHNLIPFIVQNLHYFVVEYDYKFCQYRSLELHKRETGNDCDCHQQQVGKIISAFYTAAEHLFYMSEKQRDLYIERFPFLLDNSSVLSSVFDVKDLQQIEVLNKTRKSFGNNDKWAIVNGNSWIKGVDESKSFLDDQGKTYELLGGLSYSDLLLRLSEFKGLVSQPLGHDTCPRLVIEAKLLGLELMLNENVQHASEEWFNKDRESIEMYLLEGHNRFWDRLTEHVERPISISGYTTTKDVIESDYPWRASIESMLAFCDEVIVVDGGSKDGTWEMLQYLSEENKGKLKVYQVERDWEDYRFAVFDGQQKAIARTLCTKDWCWQQDIDEVIHEDDYDKVQKLARTIPKSVKIVCLPIIDYWGKQDKVRVDVNPWKWRLSRNDTHITHGIPAQHRRYDEKGNVFSLGSDGCDYIHTDNYEPIPHMNFYTPDHEKFRQEIMINLEFRKDNIENYNNFINTAIAELPTIYHYSWFDIKRKIHTYKNYWSKHWTSLFNKPTEDTVENNMFFNKRWSDVTDEEIVNLSEKMSEDLGGWIFHSKLNFDNPTPWLRINKRHPALMKNWLKNRGVK